MKPASPEVFSSVEKSCSGQASDVAVAYASQYAEFELSAAERLRYTGVVIPIRHLDAVYDKLHERTLLGDSEGAESVRRSVRDSDKFCSTGTISISAPPFRRGYFQLDNRRSQQEYGVYRHVI